MDVQELMEELECFEQGSEVFVEIDGVIYPIICLTDDSQGVYLQVDTSDEDMR
jgi:hypothetical protein